MYLLDTNILSDLMRPVPNPGVVSWTRSVSLAKQAITSIAVGERLFGVEIYPNGQRRQALDEAIWNLVHGQFRSRILVFDTEAAETFAVLAATRRRAGRRVAEADLMIASIALNAGAMLVTRNIRHFEGFGLDVLDPWTF